MARFGATLAFADAVVKGKCPGRFSNGIVNKVEHERTNMARKTNYKFERIERERAKAAKKAAKLKAKQERAEEKREQAAPRGRAGLAAQPVAIGRSLNYV